MFQKFFSKLSEKERNVFHVALFIVMLAVVDRVFLGPVLEQINIIQSKISSEENSVKRDLRFLSYKDKIVQESESLGKYFTENVPDIDVINADFLSVIEKLATESNVVLVKSNPSNSVKEKDYSTYSANLDFSGKISDVISFMYAINSTDELLKVTRYNMSAKRGTKDEVNASMTVSKLIVSPNSLEVASAE